MTQFQTASHTLAAPSAASGSTFSSPQSRRPTFVSIGADGDEFIDFKNIDELRRMMTPNGKIYSRKRLGATARQQRMIAQAMKRARFMALLPYTSATL